MLTRALAHAGQPLAPHDLWGAWNAEPAILLGLLVAGLAYLRGRTRGRRREAERWRDRCFAGGLAAIAAALVSPLDALSGTLASAHMVQHVLLLLVAAPLLAVSAPSSALLRGSPLALRRASGRWRRRLRLTLRQAPLVASALALALLHVATIWFWHAAVPYDAAVRSEWLHALQHGSYLATALAFWRVVVSARHGAERVSRGLGVLLVFGMAMQSVMLSALLTFARSPWYEAYATTTAPWGLDRLEDQQLAGLLMWVPAGAIHVAVAVALMASWLRTSEPDPAVADVGRGRRSPSQRGSA